VIIAHPNALDTNLDRVPPECLVELDNRYVRRRNRWTFYGPFVDRLRFVISSAALIHREPLSLEEGVAKG